MLSRINDNQGEKKWYSIWWLQFRFFCFLFEISRIWKLFNRVNIFSSGETWKQDFWTIEILFFVEFESSRKKENLKEKETFQFMQKKSSNWQVSHISFFEIKAKRLKNSNIFFLEKIRFFALKFKTRYFLFIGFFLCLFFLFSKECFAVWNTIFKKLFFFLQKRKEIKNKQRKKRNSRR